MSCSHGTVSAVILGSLLWVPSAALAAVLNQGFIIQVPSGTALEASVNVASSFFQQLDPATGTLIEVQTVLEGTGSWSSPAAAPLLNLSLVTHNTAVAIGGQQPFFRPGSVSFKLGTTDRFLPELGSFIGSGLAQVDLRLNGNDGTFSTSAIGGTISYVYEPRQVAAVPEPDALWLMGAGLLALTVVRERRLAGL